jgi:ATP-dependent DNA helicase RecG
VASPEHIQQLELQRLNISFDALANYQYPLEKLDLTGFGSSVQSC